MLLVLMCDTHSINFSLTKLIIISGVLYFSGSLIPPLLYLGLANSGNSALK